MRRALAGVVLVWLVASVCSAYAQTPRIAADGRARKTAALALRNIPSAVCDSPDDVSGLVLWFETDSGVLTDANGVYDWDDQSTNDNDLTQTTDGLKPDVVSDYFAVNIDGIQPDDSDDKMVLDTAVTNLTGEVSYFLAVTPEPNANEKLWFHDNTNTYLHIGTEGSEQISIQTGSWTACTGTGEWVVNTQILVEVYRDSSDNVTCWIDGTDETSGTPNRTNTWGVNGLPSAGTNSNATIYGAMLLYDNKVSTADADCIRTYLNNKYTLYGDVADIELAIPGYGSHMNPSAEQWEYIIPGFGGFGGG